MLDNDLTFKKERLNVCVEVEIYLCAQTQIETTQIKTLMFDKVWQLACVLK